MLYPDPSRLDVGGLSWNVTFMHWVFVALTRLVLVQRFSGLNFLLSSVDHRWVNTERLSTVICWVKSHYD